MSIEVGHVYNCSEGVQTAAPDSIPASPFPSAPHSLLTDSIPAPIWKESLRVPGWEPPPLFL